MGRAVSSTTVPERTSRPDARAACASMRAVPFTRTRGAPCPSSAPAVPVTSASASASAHLAVRTHLTVRASAGASAHLTAALARAPTWEKLSSP